MGRRVLVLGDDTQSFLASVRSLGRAGLEVEASMPRPGTAARASRYLSALRPLPPLYQPQAWTEALNQLMRERDYAFVLPCYDAHAVILQARRDGLVHEERYALLNSGAYGVASSKARTYEMAKSLGIPVPAQVRVFAENELAAACEELGLPVILKPVESVTADAPAARQNVMKAYDVQQAKDGFRVLSRGEGVLLQRNFSGSGGGVEFVCAAGKPVALFQHQRLHEPMHGGQSSYRRSVALQAEMAEAAGRLARALHWTGPGMMEYRQNAAGEWVLIEVNGRLWGSLPLTVSAGIDVPLLLYKLWTGEPAGPVSPYRVGCFARNWDLDAQWLRENARANRGDRTLQRVPAVRQVAELANLLTGRECSDAFAWDDARPAWEEGRRIAERMAGRYWRLTPPARWRARHRAEEAVREARSILFLCLGNICRSPFAEHALAGRMEVSSAGLLEEPGRRSPSAAVAAAKQLGVPLGDHRSRVADAERIAQTDVIFVFEEYQAAALLDRVPEARGKIHLLGALDPRGPLEIYDPWGRSEAQFVETYRKMQRLLDLLVTIRAATPNPERRSTRESV